MRDPQTDEEWQEAVDGADALLSLDSARQYGLVTGGPKVNVNRCVAIVEEGKRRGIQPQPDNVERLVKELNS